MEKVFFKTPETIATKSLELIEHREEDSTTRVVLTVSEQSTSTATSTTASSATLVSSTTPAIMDLSELEIHTDNDDDDNISLQTTTTIRSVNNARNVAEAILNANNEQQFKFNRGNGLNPNNIYSFISLSLILVIFL